jgi:hypothetical protein
MRIATVKRLRTLASIQEYKNLHPGAIGVWAYLSTLERDGGGSC